MRLFRHPVLCNYYLTYRCNASCSFCDIWEKPSPYVHETNLRSNLLHLKRLGVRVIDFTGGEPLLHPQLQQFLQLAKNEGFITTVTTNCLLYPKQAESLAGLVDMLHFSLDSPFEAEHNASRNVDCFGHLLRSLHIAHSLGERPDVLYTVTPSNWQHIGRVLEGFCLPHNLILILNPLFSYNQVGSGLPTEALHAMRQWARHPNVYLNEAFLKLREDGGNHTANPVCRAASSTVVISPHNGLVLPCYHLGKHELPIHDNLFDLWHSPEVQQLVQQEGRLPECEGCTVNCYMQPSFAVEITPYFWRALPSTLKYSLEKWVLA